MGRRRLSPETKGGIAATGFCLSSVVACSVAANRAAEAGDRTNLALADFGVMLGGIVAIGFIEKIRHPAEPAEEEVTETIPAAENNHGYERYFHPGIGWVWQEGYEGPQYSIDN